MFVGPEASVRTFGNQPEPLCGTRATTQCQAWVAPSQGGEMLPALPLVQSWLN